MNGRSPKSTVHLQAFMSVKRHAPPTYQPQLVASTKCASAFLTTKMSLVTQPMVGLLRAALSHPKGLARTDRMTLAAACHVACVGALLCYNIRYAPAGSAPYVWLRCIYSIRHRGSIRWLAALMLCACARSTIFFDRLRPLLSHPACAHAVCHHRGTVMCGTWCAA